MKKTLILLSMVAMTTVSMAQKGTWYIGGLAGFATSTDKDPNDKKTTMSNWTVAPEVGTFLKDDIQVGLAFGIGGAKEKNDSLDLSESSFLTPTLYGRKFFKITDNFSTFAGLYLSYIGGKSTDFTNTPETKSEQSGFGARIGVGIAYALSPRFTAVGQYGLFGFQSVNNKVNGNDAGSNSSFDFGVNTVGGGTLGQGNGSGSVFNIGLYYTFITK